MVVLMIQIETSSTEQITYTGEKQKKKPLEIINWLCTYYSKRPNFKAKKIKYDFEKF